MADHTTSPEATVSSPLITPEMGPKARPDKGHSAPLVDRIVPPLILLYMPWVSALLLFYTQTLTTYSFII
jgi:hypothetical protein